jgi:hypothetical protein
MSNNRRSFFSEIASSFFISSMLFIPSLKAKETSNKQSEFLPSTATLTICVFFPPNKSTAQALVELKSCNDSNKIQEIVNDFFALGKMTEQGVSHGKDHIKYTQVFNNTNSLNEYMDKINLVNKPYRKTRESLGYKVTRDIA